MELQWLIIFAVLIAPMTHALSQLETCCPELHLDHIGPLPESSLISCSIRRPIGADRFPEEWPLFTLSGQGKALRAWIGLLVSQLQHISYPFLSDFAPSTRSEPVQ